MRYSFLLSYQFSVGPVVNRHSNPVVSQKILVGSVDVQNSTVVDYLVIIKSQCVDGVGWPSIPQASFNLISVSVALLTTSHDQIDWGLNTDLTGSTHDIYAGLLVKGAIFGMMRDLLVDGVNVEWF